MNPLFSGDRDYLPRKSRDRKYELFVLWRQRLFILKVQEQKELKHPWGRIPPPIVFGVRRLAIRTKL
jgi:hypothetical protein